MANILKKSGILIGTAGVYHVASQLAARGFHAAVTYGNAPSVDIFVGLLDGSATVSLQVKTSHWALRTRGIGKKEIPHHYEWDVGKKSAMVHRSDLFFAFVDLKWQSGQLPVVFIIPSDFVYKHFGGDEDKIKRWRFSLGVHSMREFENKWDLLWDYLKQKAKSGQGQGGRTPDTD